MKPIFVMLIFDSIKNSVFESQVLMPLLKRAEYQNIIVISFEKKAVSPDYIQELENKHHNIRFIIIPIFFFIGKITLYYAAWLLKKYINPQFDYQILARGPLAGFLALLVFKQSSITIQARGLLAEEYLYAHQKSSCLLNFLYTLRSKQYSSLERRVYTNKTGSIESVSPALKEYLIARYKILPEKISIAMHDMPQAYASEVKQSWRSLIRTQLQIPETAYVYCYSGSFKSWQCLDETFDFFKKQHAINNSSFLLILTPDKEELIKYCTYFNLPDVHYTVCSVRPDELHKYLAACDAGIIFRKNHIINWVSRPTKALEYKSMGLKIIHNNTIAYLLD